LLESKFKLGPYKFFNYELDNGLKVCLGENKKSLSIAVNVLYDVGSSRERKGLTGFAHLFEHLMFEGSKNVPKGVFFDTIFASGGKLNGFTTQDYTSYYETVPKHLISQVLYMEADRMKNLSVNEENVLNQKKVVLEEKKQSYMNKPYGKIWLEIFDLAYENFAYKHSVIGEDEDINAAQLDDFKDFYNNYYVPNNASLAIIGAINASEMKELVYENFNDIEAVTLNKRDIFKEDIFDSVKKRTINDNFIKFPAFLLTFQSPGYYDYEDSIAIEILERILFGGKSSRITLKFEKKMPYIVQHSIFNSRRIGTSQFMCFVISNEKVSLNELVDLYLEEFYKIAKEGITEEELRIAKTKLKSQYINDLRQNLNVAMQVTHDIMYFNDILYSEKRIENLLNMSVNKIKELASKYFIDNRLSILECIPN